MKKILFLFVAAFVCALGANAEVWKKVTSAPADWSGKYLIACDNGEDWAVLDGSRSGDPNSGNLQSTMNYKPYGVNADGNIELDACDYFVTIAKSGDAYTLCTASGWYIGNNADANTLGTTANAELAFLSTIALDAEQGVIIKAVEGGSVLRYNHASGQDRFRFYRASTYTNQQKIALYKLEEAAPVEPTVTFKGVVTPNLTSVSSLAELEGIELTFVDADQVSVLEEVGDGIYVQNEDGSEFYAIWHPGFGGTYEVNGNVVTLRNFFSDNTDGYFNELPTGKAALYFEDYGTFGVSNADAAWDGYFKTFSVAFEGAPVAQPFELVFRNNNVVCENGKKVEANEAGVGADFYLVNEGLTAVGKTATLYKDGNAMSFVMTLVDATAISFLGGSSQITEPGTYLLEVPAGTYVDAAGNPSVAFYGQWVVIEKEPTYVEPVLKAEDVSADVAYYIYTTQRGGLTVDGDQLKGTKEVDKQVDPTDVQQQFAFVNWEGNLYLYSVAAEKFIGKANRGNFTDEPVDPILFKNAGNGTVMLYFDDSFNFNLGGSNQVTIDTWKQKDAGNSFIIKVAEAFDQTPIFDRLTATEWNGNVNYSEAASVEDLLNLTVEFEEASSVAASGYDVLGVVYDGVEPYAIVLANGVFDVFGGISFDGSKAQVTFQKIADLDVNAQAAAKANIAKIGGFEPQAGKASVVFSGKSFLVDGELVAGALCHEYEFNGGAITGIETIATEGAARIFDLQGRRVSAAQKGFFLVNGKKVVK